MKKISEFIVNKRKLLCIVFAALAVCGAVLWFFTKINYDLSSYLPKDSETAAAIEIMSKEFGDNGALDVMASDVTPAQAAGLKKQIQGVENVRSVIWLDDVLGQYKAVAAGLTAYLGVPVDIASMDDAAFTVFILEFTGSPAFDPAALPEELRQAAGQLIQAAGQFYKDGKALFQVTFTGTAYDPSTLTAIDRIKDIRTVDIAGAAATPYAMQSVIQREITVALIIIVPLLLLILFAATSSFFDPVILIAVIGAAIIINMGSNIILGPVSYLTNSIAILLQIAISMDYSIFFLHAYKNERGKGNDPAAAAKTAFLRSFRPVSASSLTTIASFAAMLFMRYTIGLDMGLVLGKGIIISLLTVFFFMPGFVVMTDKAIQKGEHRSLLSLFSRRKKVISETVSAAPAGTVPSAETVAPAIEETVPAAALKKTAVQGSLPDGARYPERPAGKNTRTLKERLANGVMKAHFVLPLLILLSIVPAYLAQSSNNFMYGELATAGGKGSLLETNRTAVEETFGSRNNAVILLQKRLGDKEHFEKELTLTLRLAALETDGVPRISNAQSYSLLMAAAAQAGAGVPAFMAEQFIGKDNYTRIVLTLNTEEESAEAFAAADEIRRITEEELGGGYYILGGTLSTQELKSINKKDYTLVTILTLSFILLIMIITFRGLVLPVILGILITAATWIGMSIPYILGEPLVYLGYLIVSCVLMGATIDYGILLSSHFIENRKTMGAAAAAKKALMSSMGPITLSASILVMVGFTISITGMTAVSSALGLLVGRGAIISYLLMVFVLPCFLALFDKPIKFTTLKVKGNAGDPASIRTKRRGKGKS